MNKNKKTVLALLFLVLVIIAGPVAGRRDARFGGSDDAGSVMVEEITGVYKPWFTPLPEIMLGGEVPGELESLLFCVQTGLGVGILAFCMGRMVERRKWTEQEKKQKE